MTPDHSSAAIACPGCGRLTNVTVTFRNARGEVVQHCLRCGGAESGPEPPDVPMPVRSRARKRSANRGNLL